jgi:hypothetical protein
VAELLSGGRSIDRDRSQYQALLQGQARHRRRSVPQPAREKRRNGATGPRLNRNQAQTARDLAERIGVVRAAGRYDISTGTLYAAWKRYGIPTMTGRRYRARLFTYSGDHGHVHSVTSMVAYLAKYGPDATAERFGCGRATLYKYLARYAIPPPNGQGNPAPGLRPGDVATSRGRAWTGESPASGAGPGRA